MEAILHEVQGRGDPFELSQLPGILLTLSRRSRIANGNLVPSTPITPVPNKGSSQEEPINF